MKEAMGVTVLMLMATFATSCVAVRSTTQAIVAGEAQAVYAPKSPPVPSTSGDRESVSVPTPKSAPGYSFSVECPLHRGYVASHTSPRTVDGVFVGVYHCLFVGEDHERGHDFIARCN
jgi:hypothetical protein